MRKLQDGSLEIKNESFNPRLELNKLIEHFATEAEKKNIMLSVNIDSKIPQTLYGDSTRIFQVLSIVVDNALKFTSNDGKVNLSMIYDVFAKSLIYSVKDNGIGIAKENQEKVFELGQIDSKTSRSYEGVGLGLNLARNLLKVMKGTIKVKSIPNRGSMFTIEVPIKGE